MHRYLRIKTHKSVFKNVFKKFVLALCVISLIQTPLVLRQEAHAQVKEQVITDLVSAGVSVGIAMSGAVPLALVSGYLVKYISTYGVAGVKSLIDMFKTYHPKDIGEINILYVYLVHIKRNIYQTLIDIRKASEVNTDEPELKEALEKIEALIGGSCSIEKGCTPTGLDESFIDYSFLNIALDKNATLDINSYLSVQEIKHTYHYLMLLYLDLMIVEQQLLEYQTDLLSSKYLESLKEIKENDYISNPEKEYQAQLLLNIVLRWHYMSDARRIIISQAILKPLQTLKLENEQLQEEIEKYKNKGKGR